MESLISIITQYKADTESVYNTWFVNNDAWLKTFRTTRRGVLQVIDEIKNKSFPNQFKIYKMKKVIIATIVAITFTACNSNTENKEEKKATTKQTVSAATTTATQNKENAANNTNPLAIVYTSYFSLKNCLTQDNGKAAQAAAKTLLAEIEKIPMNTLNAQQDAIWMKYQKKLSFDTEHISSVDENDHQREHFVSLSKNMYEVMKVVKTDKPVYYQNCPKYNDGKGANWLSLDEKISNPYLGKSMPTCGKQIETIK